MIKEMIALIFTITVSEIKDKYKKIIYKSKKFVYFYHKIRNFSTIKHCGIVI